MAKRNELDNFLSDLFPAYGEWIDNKKDDSLSLHLVRNYIYAINAKGTTYIKIGFSRDPSSRLKDIQVSIPFPVEFVAVWDVPTPEVERQIHKKFIKQKKRGEWFDLSPDDLDDLFAMMKRYKRLQGPGCR